MAYRYKLGIEARGRGYREAEVTADNDAAMRHACDVLLEGGTKVTVIERTKIKTPALLRGKRAPKPRLTR